MERLIYRKAESVEELEGLLQLRYATFVESRLSGFLRESEDHIDIDAFDLRAVHFGLFREADGMPVGYLRRVQESVSQQAMMVNAVARRHPELAGRVEGGTPEVFPLLTYFPDKNVVQGLHRSACLRKKRMAEVGRLSLDTSIRCLSAARFMTAGTVAAGLAEGFEEAVITLAWSHRPFYERFGFVQIPGTGNHVELGVTLSCMHWTRQNLPLSIEDEILKMADRYAATGRIESWMQVEGMRRMVA